jgi:hypothetical protein
MKKPGRIAVWAFISLAFQLLLLAFIDRVYLPGRVSDVEIVKYAEIGGQKSGGKVKLPEGAQHVALSFDASYASYILGDELVIVDVAGGEEEMVLQEGFVPDFYKWLPDRNMLIYSTRKKGDVRGDIYVETYDADSGVVRDYPEISGLPEGSKVVDIQLSTLTNLVYVKVAAGPARAEIYCYNIMEELSHVMAVSPDTDMHLLNYSDILLYQRNGSDIFVRYNSKGEEREFDLGNSVILGVDVEDVVYLGERDQNGNVERIKYGTLQEIQEGKFSYAELIIPCSPEHICIAQDGSIYLNERDKRMLHELKGEIAMEYRGKYVGVFGKYLVTMDNDVLYIEIV